MITRLEIQGLAIIDRLSIEFSPGFNVITGETGAGKSILIKGINLLMGAKAAPDQVRKGCDAATITGEFWVPSNHKALLAMEKLGITPDREESGTAILLRRQIGQKSRSQCWVNDTPVTSQALRELGVTLIDVFGQHENQRLMDESQHVRYLDDSPCPDPTLLEKVRHLYEACSAQVKEIETGLNLLRTGDRNRDYVSFRLEALKEFSPTQEDFERISALCREKDRAIGLRDTLVTAVHLLDGADTELSPGKAVREAARLLGKVPPDLVGSVADLRERACDLATDLDDLSFELGKVASSFDINEEELEAAQARLFGYQDLFRKQGVRGD